MDKKHEDIPIVCDLTVFSAEERNEMTANLPDMFQSVDKVQELPDGYAFQFPNEPDMFMTLANFVDHERRCCPFYYFSLEAEPNNGPFWLKLTGSDEVKAFITEVWSDVMSAVEGGLIQTGPGHDLDEAIAETTPVLAEVMAGKQ